MAQVSTALSAAVGNASTAFFMEQTVSSHPVSSFQNHTLMFRPQISSPVRLSTTGAGKYFGAWDSPEPRRRGISPLCADGCAIA
jgi:hypothetical protein